MGRPCRNIPGPDGGSVARDGGLTWRPVTDGQLKSSSVGAVAVAESNPDVVYIGMGETELRGNIMQGDGVYKSTDAGKTWKHSGLADSQAISRIRVHPTNPEHVLCGGVDLHRSTNGGSTWQQITRWDLDRGNAQYAHADHHCLMMPAM